MAQDRDGLSGRDLQQSQSGGDSGEFGGNMDQQQRTGQAAGGPGPSDAGNPGGSSGYGSSQNVVNHQGQQGSGSGAAGGSTGQSRGEAYDEAQGGGRGPESVSRDDEEEFAEDQQAHQDRGQSEAEFEREQP